MLRPSTARAGVLLLAFAQHARAFQEAHELDARNYAKVSEGVWLLKFYAPWCTHCKKLQPVFEEVAEHFHRQGGEVRVGRVDATAQPGLAEPFEIKGYPTMILLRDGRQIAEFKGPRTFKAITSFVESASRDAPHAPAAPRAASPGKARPASSRLSHEALVSRLTQWGLWLTELDSMQAALIVLATVGALLVGFMVILCATTTAAPR